MVSGPSKSAVITHLTDTPSDCRRISQNIGMDFEVTKMEWLGFGREDWACITVDDEPLVPTKEIRILGYRFNTTGNDKAHADYWIARGLEVRRRINALGRRFGSHGGIGAWECIRLIKGVFIPTVWYGLELLNGEEKSLKSIQVAINDSIRSIFLSH